jgi:hypothetical protein
MFRSAHEALTWAFRISGAPIVKMSSINTMMGSMTAGSSSLSPQERHAEAALIYAAVERAVDVNGIAYLNAYYGAQLRNGAAERDVANAMVRIAIGGLPTGMHSNRGVEAIVRNYFGEQIQRAAILRHLDCTMRRYYEYKEFIYGTLDKVAARAEDQAQRALEDAGIVGAEEVAT